MREILIDGYRLTRVRTYSGLRRRTRRMGKMITKDSVGWRVRLYTEDEGALTDAQIQQLGTDHGLDIDTLQTLSIGLTIALDPQRQLMRDEMKPLQEARADKEVEAAINELEAALKKLMSVRAKIEAVRFKSLFVYTGAPNASIAQRVDFDLAIADVASFRRYLAVMLRGGLISFREISDKRRVKDERRRVVCWFIFKFWQENGRKLSYTTDPDTSERTGPLVEFVNSIVACISDPPGKISGETIKSEIDAFKARPS